MFHSHSSQTLELCGEGLCITLPAHFQIILLLWRIHSRFIAEPRNPLRKEPPGCVKKDPPPQNNQISFWGGARAFGSFRAPQEVPMRSLNSALEHPVYWHLLPAPPAFCKTGKKPTLTILHLQDT